MEGDTKRDSEFKEPAEEEPSKLTLRFENISVTLHQGTVFRKGRIMKNPDKKFLLKDITGEVKSGRLVALMGSSGSGKTTFLNALMNNTASNMSFRGNITVNGSAINMRKISSYIQQSDLFFARFTVKEHLKFYIELNARTKRTVEEKKILMSQLVETFSLKKILNTTIGDGILHVGISGGEKKRLCIAAELIKEPDIVYADEPTSGLDYYMAKSVIKSLKNVVEQGKIVIVTIHQPASQIFALFDHILLLSAGELILSSSIRLALHIFELADLKCPSKYNPADHIIHQTSITPGNEEECRQKIKKISDTAKNYMNRSSSSVKICPTNEVQEEKKKYKPNIFLQFWETSKREAKTILREPALFYAKIVANIIAGITIGALFFQLKFSASNYQNMLSCLNLITLMVTFMNLFVVINNFPLELNIFNRENRNRLYGITPYFLSKLVCELPVLIIINLLYTFIAYYLIGLRRTTEAVLTLIFVTILITECSYSLAYIISTCITNIKVSSIVATPFILILIMLGGFLLPLNQMPKYVQWLSYLSWFRYGFEILIISQLNEYIIDCDDPTIKYCQNNTKIDASYNFEVLGVDTDRFWLDIMSLIMIAVLYRLLAYFALLFRGRKNR